jgi:hypothetical protein
VTAGSVAALLQVFSLFSCLGVIIRIVQTRLYRRFPVFALYFVFPLCIQLVTVFYGICSLQLCRVYPPIEVLRNVVYILAISELFSALPPAYSELWPRRNHTFAVVVALASGLLFSFVAPGSHMFRGLILSIAKMERGITLALGILTAAALYHLSKYSIRVAPQLKVMLTFWTVWFLGDAATLGAVSLVPAGSQFIVNDGLAVFEIASYVGWAVLLKQCRDIPMNGSSSNAWSASRL